jgi:serine/threonine protein kinase
MSGPKPRIDWSAIVFDKDHPLGKGPYGTSYPGEATTPSGKVQISVKLMQVRAPDQQKYFLREIEAGSKLYHPALLNSLSWSTEVNGIAIERGVTDLKKVLDLKTTPDPFRYSAPGGKTIEWDDTRKAIAAFGIAVGMCHMHDHGLIHRDLKPANIALDENLWPRIGEFRLAKTADSLAMTMVGTRVYMAPEMFVDMDKLSAIDLKDEDAGDYDVTYTGQVDVYAYGMILCDIVTPTPLPDLKNKATRPEIPESVTPAYRDLITRCWAQKPEDRPKFREIVAQVQGEVLALPGTNKAEFLAYQKKMMDALGTGK